MANKGCYRNNFIDQKKNKKRKAGNYTASPQMHKNLKISALNVGNAGMDRNGLQKVNNTADQDIRK